MKPIDKAPTAKTIEWFLIEWIPIIRQASRGYEEDGYPEGMEIIISELPGYGYRMGSIA